MKRLTLGAAAFLLFSGFGLAQGSYHARRPGSGDPELARTAREIPSSSKINPVWENPRDFAKDVFTFARLRYSSGSGGAFIGATEGWATDAPDSDLNLSYRLQQMTSMKVDPDGRVIDLTDPDLGKYPWIYIVEAGGLYFTREEEAALRRYLENGGFIMFDDFWGDRAWKNVEFYMKRVLPNRRFVEMPLEHELYHCVFEISAKGQVPNSGTGTDAEQTGITYESNHDGDVKTVHHRGIFDEKGRLMVLATHNTDTGEGWEGEGENEFFFRTFSEKIAYPLGINIIFYVMTH